MSVKLENFGDLHKWSKELLDDDFNHGKYLVVKTKNVAAESNSVSLARINIMDFQPIH